MSSAILCVDDEALIVYCLKQDLLRHFGDRYQYETALSAKDAFERIEELDEEGVSLAVVITDWIMPGMRGDEFLIAVERKYPGTKAIILSGQAEEESIQRIKERCNLLAFFGKPYRAAAICSLIEKSDGACG
jgi:CheY-like chemotaxis protein